MPLLLLVLCTISTSHQAREPAFEMAVVPVPCSTVLSPTWWCLGPSSCASPCCSSCSFLLLPSSPPSNGIALSSMLRSLRFAAAGAELHEGTSWMAAGRLRHTRSLAQLQASQLPPFPSASSANPAGDAAVHAASASAAAAATVANLTGAHQSSWHPSRSAKGPCTITVINLKPLTVLSLPMMLLQKHAWCPFRQGTH